MLEGAPQFEPVPRLHVRHDGWTPERQRAFIKALAETGASLTKVRSRCFVGRGWNGWLRAKPAAGEARIIGRATTDARHSTDPCLSLADRCAIPSRLARLMTNRFACGTVMPAGG